MNYKRIIIIGCGYVGKAIARLWTEIGHEVTVTTTTPDKLETLQAIATRSILLKGDDLEGMEKAIADQDIILLSVGAKPRTPQGYQEAYLNTAKTLVNALKHNRTVKQVIYTGTHAVLGNKGGEWVDETAPVAPANELGEILCQTEQVLLSAQRNDLKVCILRLAGIYGVGREIINIFRSWAGTTRPGDGHDYTNWIELEDIVEALALAQEQQLEGIYHVVNDTPLMTKDFFSRLFAKYNLPSINWDSSVPSSRPFNVRLSNQKIKAAGLKLIHPEFDF